MIAVITAFFRSYGPSSGTRWTLPSRFGFIASLLLGLVLGTPSGSATGAERGGTILVYGDSLSAAYGISQKDGWVALLQQRLRKTHPDYTVANASISGETSSGGASRIAQTLARHKPAITIVDLGGNDGLRGLPVAQMHNNLASIIRSAQQSGSKVLIVGMHMPPNYGLAYTREFGAAFLKLSQRFKAPLVPLLLAGVAERPELFQPDQLHPTAQAQPILLENVWKGLRPLL